MDRAAWVEHRDARVRADHQSHPHAPFGYAKQGRAEDDFALVDAGAQRGRVEDDFGAIGRAPGGSRQSR